MRFLKTLQKNQIEQPLNHDALDNIVSPNKIESNIEGESSNEVVSEIEKDNLERSPEFSFIPDVKIGRPNLTFHHQPSQSSDLLIETLPADSEPENVKKIPLISFTETRDRGQPFLDSYEIKLIDRERVNPHLVAITDHDSSYCEQYRNLRTQILNQNQKRRLQSIIIASVGLSEGKSVTALNLSWLLAQTDGIKTLLVDGDLRRPSLANYLGIQTTFGLSEVLEGKTSPEKAIVELKPSGLHLLAAGEVRSDTAELISGQKFKEIFAQISELFDFVIIDAPPLGIFTDANVLINQADGALLVMRANQTRYKDIERALEMLPREKMIGAVLNQSEDSLIKNSYYSYDDYKKRD